MQNPTLSALIDATRPEDLPALAGTLAEAQAIVVARIAAGPTTHEASPEPDDGLLTVNEAAERLGVKPRWLYRNAKTLPFTRKLGHRTLRFDPNQLARWQRTRPAA